MRLLHIGHGNIVAAERIVAIVSPDSAPMKRLKDDARDAGKLVDATQGRRTRSIIVTDSDHVILCALAAETLAERAANLTARGTPGTTPVDDEVEEIP